MSAPRSQRTFSSVSLNAPCQSRPSYSNVSQTLVEVQWIYAYWVWLFFSNRRAEKQGEFEEASAAASQS